MSKTKHPHQWTSEEKKQLRILHAKRYNKNQIACEMNKTPSQINNALTRYVYGKEKPITSSRYIQRPRTTSGKDFRMCLKCLNDFFSDGSGNRICPKCKNTNNARGSHISTYRVAL